MVLVYEKPFFMSLYLIRLLKKNNSAHFCGNKQIQNKFQLFKNVQA